MRRRKNSFAELIGSPLIVASVVIFLLAGVLWVRYRTTGQAADADGPPRPAVVAKAGTARPAVKSSPRVSKPAARPAESEVVHDEMDEGISPIPAGGKSTEVAETPRAAPSASSPEYESRRARTPATAKAQADLARWCDGAGLKEEARTHWEAVTRLDPSNKVAWTHLGYTQVRGRWVTEAMLAEESAQEKADRDWKRRIDELHRRMHGKGPDAAGKRAEAETELVKVTDPRAAPSMWRAFAPDSTHHDLLARRLRSLRSPRSSRMMAAVAIYSQDPKARLIAVDGLKDRDPTEFAEPVIALLSRPLKHKETTIAGAANMRIKVLEIEDEQVKTQFVYAAATGLPEDTSAFGACASRLLARGWTQEGRAMAREINAEQARLAAAAADQQLRSDIAVVESINASVSELNERASGLLASAAGTRLGDDRESWRRWLADRAGRAYTPPQQVAKLTVAQFVQPLYQPNFIDVPAPS